MNPRCRTSSRAAVVRVATTAARADYGHRLLAVAVTALREGMQRCSWMARINLSTDSSPLAFFCKP
jgi:hypothetical protein